MAAGPDILATLEPAPAPVPDSGGGARWAIAGGVAVVLLGLGLSVRVWTGGAPEVSYTRSQVARQDIQQTVSSTGTLEAVTTVDVGTQVSGRITELLVDYNDDVASGQILAQIDPVLLKAEVESAQATLTQRRASAALARQELERTEYLAAREAATPQELQVAEAATVEGNALVRSAQVALNRAQRNLEYATIVSPIDGTVVSREVEVGQTVNAGTSTPTLYTLVGDLDEMQILATVDEADIGVLKPDQAATFTVQAWPDRSFEGKVRKVRLQSTTTDSVVTYTAVIDVPNEERLLLPGMTTSVDFVVAEAENVLAVPRAALRFKPDREALPERPKGERSKAGGGQRGGESKQEAGDEEWGTVWISDEGGDLRPLRVRIGLSDAAMVEVSGEGLEEGLHVVTGQQAVGESEASSSPFQSESEGRRGPGGPGGF